ncbi:hypothetical protein Tco_0931197 [Tanacetum coccineum]
MSPMTTGRFAERDGVANSVMISSASGLAQQGYKVDRKSVILKSSGQPQNLDVLGLRPRFDQWQGTSSYYSSLVDITWLGLDRTWQAQLNFGGPYNAIMSIDKALAIKETQNSRYLQFNALSYSKFYLIASLYLASDMLCYKDDNLLSS